MALLRGTGTNGKRINNANFETNNCFR